MVRKTIGYVELEWTCPRCGTRNPGSRETCSSCGAAQPKNVEFDQGTEQELITDEEKIARAEAGPDVHCAFCGARNPAGAVKCAQCGADLGSATARESGRVVGAYQPGSAPQVKCPQCGTLNAPNALRCAQCNATLPRPTRPKSADVRPKAQTPSAKGGKSRLLVAGLVAIPLLAIVACIALIVITRVLPTQEVVGQVRALEWTREIEIEELQPVTREDWADEIPSQAAPGTCTQKYHHTQDEPAPKATEVCGTPYTLDTGTGQGKVVKDCQYRVYAEWCEYTTEEWRQVDPATLSGNDLNPRWPELRLAGRQREGKREEQYAVTFDTEDRSYTYHTSDVDRFLQYEIGSRWILEVNALNNVRSTKPAR
jgi:ribosomal protein L40E